MSDRLAAKIKENAGKPKYSSLNLNQTYKGNKVEIKTSSGAARHGLQSLGKIGSSRRIPPPANLPSLKSENSGNDPTVSLVPSGGGGWGSTKDKPESTTQSSTPPPPPQTNAAVNQQPILQPQRPTGPLSFPSSQPPVQQQQQQNSAPTRQETATTKQEKNEAHAKTWGSVSQNEAGGQGKPYSPQPTPYFNREFPTLGVQDNGERRENGKENSGPPVVIRNTHEPPWMERSGPGPPSHSYRGSDNLPGGPRRPPDFQNARNAQYPQQHYGNNYRPQHGHPGYDQNERPGYQRPGHGPRQGAQDKRQDNIRDKPPIRPTVLRPEDIQAMDDEDDDGGWAGAHGEVDYTAKLNFEDFDDEDRDKNMHRDEDNRQQRQPQDRQTEREKVKDPIVLKRPIGNDRPKQPPKSAWGELPQRPQQFIGGDRHDRRQDNQRQEQEHRGAWNKQYPPPGQSQHRGMPPEQYKQVPEHTLKERDPSPARQPSDEQPPTRKDGEDSDEWTVRRKQQHNEMHAAAERARKRREQEELELQAKVKAAALMKLKAIEGKTGDKTKDETGEKEVWTDHVESDLPREKTDKGVDIPSVDRKVVQSRPEDLPRRRTDSDSSDASRSSGSRQFFHQQRTIPPRFQQQRQQQQQQYQQQQLYQATHGAVTHPRDTSEPTRPPLQATDSGPISPSAKMTRPGDDVPVKRIMKRTDSSSTAGDDVASVKSLESVGEKDKDRSSKMTPTEPDIIKPSSKHKPKESAVQTTTEDKAKKPESRAESKRTDNEEKPNNRSEKTGEKEEHTSKPSTIARKREYQTSERKTEEPHKRKRDESEDARWDDKRNKAFKERQTDGHSRGRSVSSMRGRGRGASRGRQDYRSGGFDNRQRYTRDPKPRDYRDHRKEFTDKHERVTKEMNTTEDQKDAQSKTPVEDNKENVSQKNEGKSDNDNQDQKVFTKERTYNKENQGERRTERFDRRNDRYDRRDDRDQRTRPKSYDSRRDNRDDSKRDFSRSKDDTRRDYSKDNRDEHRRGKPSSRGQRDDEQVKPSDQSSQLKDENKARDTNNFRGKPREDYDRRNKDYDNYRDKNSRDYHVTRQDRGGHRGHLSTRGRGRPIGRGVYRGSGRTVGSGRIVAANIKKKEECSSDEGDDSGSESSSYTTATSASEERPEEKEEKNVEHHRSASQSSNTTRTVRSTRGTRGRGGNYVRSRPQQEKPPRFQKQQERAAQQKNFSRAGQRGNRDSVRGGGRGRGRGRGRIVSSSKDNEEIRSTQIETTEDWDDDVDNGPKDHPKDEKPSRRGGYSRSSGSNRRLPPKDDSGKSSSRQQNTQSRGESFLSEKQVKGDGSKSVSMEPRGSLPAGKNTDSNKKNTGAPKDNTRTDYSALDSIDGKVPKKNDTAKKANIELFDLHNVAGVICIDDIPDDASDISSSGFVEVTSKRTQKEIKEKQREEDERKKRNEEKTSHQSSDMKFKKGQVNKPPRFSKQHQTNANQSKSFDGKLPGAAPLENTGLVSGGVDSNSSSTNSTKRNSPVTVERSLSPQGPVFNAWNKPLTLVTPAKAPGSALVVTSSVPDPLAVGSGKPSRQAQPSNVVPIQNSLINSNIEDTSAEDELKEMTKEIESMAPTEEQEEVSSVTKGNKKSTTDTVSGRDKRHDGDKKAQPKSQRERPPRFEKTAKRKTPNGETSKKDFHKGDEGKKDKDLLPKDKESKEPFQGKSTHEKKFENIENKKQKEDAVVKTGKLVADESTEKVVEDDTIAARKDSDYSVDSEDHGSGDSSMFSSRPLSVDITDSSSETQERPPTPVSPAYEEMGKRFLAARKAWEEAPTSTVGLTSVSMDTSSTWSEGNASSVSRSGAVSTSSKETSSIGEVASEDVSESRESAEVAVSKPDIAKPSETQFSSKKPGVNEQQNVCKVKPQQQAVKPQHTTENRQQEMDTVMPTQPVIAQEHLLPHGIPSSYSFQLEPQLLQLRQTQHFIQPVQSLQQSAQVAANRFQIPAQLQQVPHQPTSAPSPLSQSPQELFQSQYLASNLYSASGFSGSQSFVSIPMVATTTTQSYSTSSSRTQAIPGQQPKTVTSSMFGQPGSQTQTVYMPFDPQGISGPATLLNFNQQSQAQRPLISGHRVGFTDVLTQQPHLAQGTHHQAPQQFQRPFAFPTKPTYNEADHNAAMKQVDQSHNDYSHQQSEMVKHINAKPFEPPKRMATPTSLSTSSAANVGLIPSGVNPNVVHIRPNPPNIGALSQSPPIQTSFISNSPVSMSPVDPNVPFAGANSYAKHAPIGHFQVPQQQPQQQQPSVQQFTPFQQQPVHIKPQQLQHHQHIRLQHGQPGNAQQQHSAGPIATTGGAGIPHQALMQRQYGPVGTVGPQHQVNQQRFPGPIQRPPPAGVMPNMAPNVLQHQPRPMQQQRPIRQQVPRMPHNIQKPPLLATRPPIPQQIQPGLQQTPQNQFKALQHQKMLEETRMFFAAQDQQVKMKSQHPGGDGVGVNQQQIQKQGQPPQQSTMKQIHAPIKQGQDPKIAPQNLRQPMQPKQSPIAPLSGAHHHNKPPRMSQDKSKQSNQEKKDKKEENKSHIIELPRKKPQDSGNKSKQGKPEITKGDDTSQMTRSDGKAPINKRGGPIRIPPMIQKPLPAGGRGGSRPNKPRQPFNKNMSQNAQPNKPKAETTSSSATRAATGTPSSTVAVPAKVADIQVPKGNSLEGSSPKEAKEVKPVLPTAS